MYPGMDTYLAKNMKKFLFLKTPKTKKGYCISFQQCIYSAEY